MLLRSPHPFSRSQNRVGVSLIRRVAIVAILAVAAVGPAGTATGQGGATVRLSYVDKASDKVGAASQATPDGRPDGHFRLAVTANDTITAITLRTLDANGQAPIDANGKPCCGQIWNTVPNDPWWILGVFRGGTQLNPVDKNISAPLAGSVTYDLYAPDFGYLKPGQRLVVSVNFASGSCVSALTQIGGQSTAGGSCSDYATQAGPPAGSDWGANAMSLRGKNGSRFTYACPAGGIVGSVWGTDGYTDDSSVCTAAVHAGLITLVNGGMVTIEIRAGLSSYTGSSRNGVTSASHVASTGSFAVVGARAGGGATGGAPPSTTTTPTGGSAPPATGTATGTVLVNGRPFTAGTIPYNSTVDVTNGTLLLKTDTGSLTVHGAGGISAVFVLLRGTDHKKPIVELRLTKGNFSVCGKRKTSSASKALATTVRQLWGNGKGRFRTRGRYASATVRGTFWLTADRCDGTLTQVNRGIMRVSDFPLNKQITVRAGKSYLAKP